MTQPAELQRRGLVTSERSRDVDVWNEVPLVPQLTGMSCWAAAAAMLVGWRDRIVVDASAVARGSGHWQEYRHGLMPEDVHALASAWGLVIADAAAFDADTLYELLAGVGPVWLGEASPGLHAIVVTGLHGDGGDDTTFVRINDPWPIGRGERYVLSFREFIKNFRAATDAVGTHAQVLHAGGRGGTRRRWSVREHVSTTTLLSPGVKEDAMSKNNGPARVSALGTLPAGTRFIQSSVLGVDPLKSHGGSGENLYLAWTALDADLTSIDVILHLHGYTDGAPNRSTLNAMVKRSGADLSGRSRPSLVIVPRGRKITQAEIDEKVAKGEKPRKDRYTFGGLTSDDGLGLEQLLANTLAWFCTEVLGRPSGALLIDRLLLTAHSGGGFPLNTLLRQHAKRQACNPHEVHVFDAVYDTDRKTGKATGAASDGIAGWAKAQLEANGSPGESALRLLWTDGTRSGAKWIADAIGAIPANVSRYYRLEYAGIADYEHLLIPGKYGPLLLADAGADLPLPAAQGLSQAAYGTPMGLFRHYQSDPGESAAPVRAAGRLLALNGGRSLALSTPGGARPRSERELDELVSEPGAGRGRSMALPIRVRALATWAGDGVSPDYRHLAAYPGECVPFVFTAVCLARLAAANRFTLPDSGKVVFGLRGCRIVEGDDGQFHDRVQLEDDIPNHITSACVLGVWDRSTGRIAVFRGSTVPHERYMRKQVGDTGDEANLLVTGEHHFSVGRHRGKVDGMLREDEERVVLRSRDDLVYTTSDDFVRANPGDNLHPSFAPGSAEYSSAGCVTVRGNASDYDAPEAPDQHSDPDDGTPGWATFRDRLGLTRDSAPAAENGTKFTFVLLTGREAFIVARDGSADDLVRLRFGSSGADVESLQRFLASQPNEAQGRYAGSVDGGMGASTTLAWIRYQQHRDGGTADGIVTPRDAASMGFTLAPAPVIGRARGAAYGRVVPGRGYHPARVRAEALVDKNSSQAEQSEAVRTNIARSVADAETNTRFDLLHYDSQRVNFGIGSWTGSRIADLLDTIESIAGGLGIKAALHGHFGNQATFDGLRNRFRSQGATTTLTQAEEGFFVALGQDKSLQDAQIQHLANDVRRDIDAIGSRVNNPWYPFIDSYMDAISELAGHVLVHASHQGNVQSMLVDVIAHFGGDQALGQGMVAGTITEPAFLRQVGEEVVSRVKAQYQNGVRNRYAKLLNTWSSSDLAYYFHPS